MSVFDMMRAVVVEATEGVQSHHRRSANAICTLGANLIRVLIYVEGAITQFCVRAGYLLFRAPSVVCIFLFLFVDWFKPQSDIEELKGSMPPCIDHMELLAWMQRADFSEHIQRFKLHGNPLNTPHFDAPNTKFAPTGYRRAPNIISHHYKQQLSAKASIIPKARPIRFR